MKRKVFHWLLIMLGFALMAAGTIALSGGPDISQYVFLNREADWAELLSRAETEWADLFSEISLCRTAEGINLSAGNRSQGEVTLYETLGEYFAGYPRAWQEGRPLTRGDASERVIVLDSDLAFQLFGDQSPLDQEVRLGEKSFRVVGVARPHRSAGSRGKYEAWISLTAEGAPEGAVVMLSARGAAKGGLQTMFETGAREIFGSGQAIFLPRERLRGRAPLMGVLMLLGVYLLLTVWAGWVKRRVRGWMMEARDRLKRLYPRQMAGWLLLRGAGMLLLAALTILMGFGLAAGGVKLLNAFPEWVPDSLVDPESIARRFRELTAAAAERIRFTTPELAEIRFWSGMIQGGLVCGLLGWALDGNPLIKALQSAPGSDTISR